MSDIRQVVRESKAIELQIAELNARLVANKKLLQEYFDKKRINSIQANGLEEGSSALVAIKHERVNVEYDIEELKKHLPSDFIPRVVSRSYIITDIERLKTMLKECGASSAVFKQCIKVDESVDKKQLSQLYSMGDITMEDLKGTFTAKVTKYVTIEERKGD